MKGPFIVFRVIAALLFLALIVAGGFFAYRAGVAEGIAQAPQVAEAIEQAGENGQVLPPMYGYGHGYGFHRSHFGFFPFGILGGLFLLFLFFGFIRMLVFGSMHYHGHHRHGPWGRHWEDGVPPMFSEWHKRAHGQAGSEDENSSEEKK